MSTQSIVETEIKKTLLENGLSNENSTVLSRFGGVLLKINERKNLTGAKDPKVLALSHLLDTFLAFEVFKQHRKIERYSGVWDIGSGGGIPGLPILLTHPEYSGVLVERRDSKAKCLLEMTEELGVSNRVSVEARPFEALKPYSSDVSFWFRGFLPGPKLIQYFSLNFKPQEIGEIVLMKGPSWLKEKEEALQEKKIQEKWLERFHNAEEVEYSLTDDLGTRTLVII